MVLRSDRRFNTITFLSDYGHSDEFVGVVHSVVRTLAPQVRMIDLTHDVRPHDVRAGGLALARSVNYMAPGVVLGVVDPGVGSQRRGVAIEVADGEAYLVGPDNGLLAPAVAIVGGATAAVSLDNPDYQLPRDPDHPATTFDGRDVFAPAAAHLCNGVPLAELGNRVDPALLTPGLLPVSEVADDGSLRAEVLWIDRFGNAQLNVDPDDLDGWPEAVTLETGSVGRVHRRVANRVRSFAEIPTGGVGFLVDSYGLIALSVNRGSVAAELDLAEGAEVTLWPADAVPTNAGPSTTSSVSLGTTRPGSVAGPGSHPGAADRSAGPSTQRPDEDPSCAQP